MSRSEGQRPATGRPGRPRDAERTRAAVLDAAERLVTEHGTGVSLARIAKEAGVTKSGLLHHFPSREDVEAALVRRVLERFWDEVEAQREPGDTRPGAFCRAYVRAHTGDSAYIAEVASPSGLLAHLGMSGMDHILEIDPADPDRWNRAFEADGLPPGRAWVIRYAAEGIALGHGTAYLTAEQLRLAREELLRLTEL